MLVTALLAWLTLAGAAQGEARAEAELTALFERLGAGETEVEPEIRERALAGEEAWLSGAQWTAALLGSGALRVRSRWPAGEPFAIRLVEPAWIAAAIDLRPADPKLRGATLLGSFRPRTGDGRYAPRRCNFEPPWSSRAPGLVLGSLAPGRHDLRLHIDVGQRTGAGFDTTLSESFGWRGWIDFAVEVVEREAVLDCVDDSWLRDEIRSALRLAEYDYGLAVLMLHPRRAWDERVGLSLVFELLHRGRVVATAALDEMQGRCVFPLHPDWSNPELWSLRVRGVAGTTHLDWNATRRWGGSVEVPLVPGRDHRWTRLWAPRGR